MASKRPVPLTNAERGIVNLVDKYKDQNFGWGYMEWRWLRERDINTANLAKIFDKTWHTTRAWEKLDNATFGKPDIKKK